MNSDVYVRQSGDALQSEVTAPVIINEAQKVLGAGAAPAPERTSKKNDLRQDTEKAEPKMMRKRHWATTKRGYQLFEVLSAMQKAIRRGDTRMAAYWAAEAYDESNKAARTRVWNRLMVISAEDCAGTTAQHVVSLRTQEINAVLHKETEALREADESVNRNKAGGPKNPPCVLFAMKAARLLAMAPKCRDGDNFYCLVYRPAAIPEKELEADLKAGSLDEKEPIPPEACDKHTRTGQRIIREKGWTEKQALEDFVSRETKALKPRAKGEFDELLDGLAELPWPENRASN
jgi:hypothetical protein